MRSTSAGLTFALTLLACLSAAAPVSAQALEITPFVGYRFGGDFFELLTRQRLDVGGAPSVGVAGDVPTRGGFQIEGLFTHQTAQVAVPAYPAGPSVRWRLTVDHWQAGGLQEFERGRVRPFLIGGLGLTRYGAGGDNELRFAASGGGGVKLFPAPHVGVRLNGQIFATIADGELGALACSSAAGACFIGISAAVVWQAEFTAGLVVRFF